MVDFQEEEIVFKVQIILDDNQKPLLQNYDALFQGLQQKFG